MDQSNSSLGTSFYFFLITCNDCGCPTKPIPNWKIEVMLFTFVGKKGRRRRRDTLPGPGVIKEREEGGRRE
jgi:hypothetical protein